MGLPESVTLFNRTQGNLRCMFDGQDFTIKPGKNHGFPRVAVRFAKDQNPVMGSEDPYNPHDVQFLVGVAAWGDPVDPIEQTSSRERMDRSKIEGEGKDAVPGPSSPPRYGEIYGSRQPTDGAEAAANI